MDIKKVETKNVLQVMAEVRRIGYKINALEIAIANIEKNHHNEAFYLKEMINDLDKRRETIESKLEKIQVEID